ncbi:unnamed protein product, partial [Polarella glacialis]
HRRRLPAPGPTVVKLPPVKESSPQPIGGLWRWHGGPPLPADVESAVTMMTPSIVPSMVPSFLSAAPSYSRLSAAAPIAEEPVMKELPAGTSEVSLSAPQPGGHRRRKPA